MGKSSTDDDAGRIPKRAFITSVLVLLGVCVITAAARFFIRIRYQKQVSTDDAFLLFGLCCMISSVGVIFVFIDSLYLLEALDFGTSQSVPSDFIEQAWATQKYSAVSLVLCWLAIVSVKFSFLFLFKKLVDRVPLMNMYWWVVLVFNAVISGYGVSVYFIACPHFYVYSDLACGTGSAAWRAARYSISQIVLDVIGDLLILYIPIHLILRIQIRYTQKFALLSSLCLTFIIISITIIKASGLRHGSDIDNVWEIYFQIIGAEIGLIMTAATAFRTFFVARSNEKSSVGRRRGSMGDAGRTETSTFRRFCEKFLGSGSEDEGGYGLDSMPGPRMTGGRGFVEGNGNGSRDANGTMGSGSRMGLRSEVTVGEMPGDEMWPLQMPPSTHKQDTKSIMVKKDISFLSERNSSSSEYMRGNAT